MFKKNYCFGVPFWYAKVKQKMHPQYLGGHSEIKEYIRILDITRTKNESYPYRLTIDGNFKGDFKTLKHAKEFALNECKDVED